MEVYTIGRQYMRIKIIKLLNRIDERCSMILVLTPLLHSTIIFDDLVLLIKIKGVNVKNSPSTKVFSHFE